MPLRRLSHLPVLDAPQPVRAIATAARPISVGGAGPAAPLPMQGGWPAAVSDRPRQAPGARGERSHRRRAGGDVTIMKTTQPGAFAVTELAGDLGSRVAARVVAVQSSTAGSLRLVAELSAALILEGSGS